MVMLVGEHVLKRWWHISKLNSLQKSCNIYLLVAWSEKVPGKLVFVEESDLDDITKINTFVAVLRYNKNHTLLSGIGII